MIENNNAKDLFMAGVGEFAQTSYDKSVDLLTQSISVDPTYILAIVSRGAAYLKQDMLNRARADFDRAIEIDHGYAKAYHLRGLVDEKRGDDMLALADFDRAIELDPEYGAAYYSRAALHDKLNHTDKALADTEMVVHLGNRNLESYMSDSNVWQTQHMRVEDYLETELER